MYELYVGDDEMVDNRVEVWILDFEVLQVREIDDLIGRAVEEGEVGGYNVNFHQL